jgi:hypothetical protein
MKVYHFGGSQQIDNAAALERILSLRFDGLNEILLSPDHRQFPLLTIFAKNDLAVLHYTPADGEAGYASCGNDPRLKPDQTTAFATGTSTQRIDVANRAIVSMSSAAAAAKEFLLSTELPQSVEWVKL